jgi:hypothetical protein
MASSPRSGALEHAFQKTQKLIAKANRDAESQLIANYPNCGMHVLPGRIERLPDASTKEKCGRRKAPMPEMMKRGIF